MSNSLLALITVPFFTGAIGYVTNWAGVLMLFYPVHVRGVRAPPSGYPVPASKMAFDS